MELSAKLVNGLGQEVDPFIGTAPADLPEQSGLAASWWWPKPPVGNTHPGATYPFGMVSACAYSGAYPTGYGRYDRSTEGIPPVYADTTRASGFSHFQQSGTGAIRKYYNYLRVTPLIGDLDQLGNSWPLTDEVARPGYYAATLGSGIRCELTVGPKSVVHRYTFPETSDAKVAIDCSHGGLDIDHGATVPLRASAQAMSAQQAFGEVVMEGVPLGFSATCRSPEWRQMVWYNRAAIHGGSQLHFDSIRASTVKPFGLLFAGPTTAGQVVELEIGFSLRGWDQAEKNLESDREEARPFDRASGFDARCQATERTWNEHLDRVRVSSPSLERRSILATALYHAMIKPCFAPNESPYWAADGPWAFDICTMWDIYRTQLPLLTAMFPSRAVDLANALLTICEEEGNLPIGYRMARGADRFFRQGSALAHTFLADLCGLGLGGVDWERALSHMDADLRRQYGEEFLENGVVHPVTHTLDLAYGYHCTAAVADHVGDRALVTQLEALATRWQNAFDPVTGLVVDSSFYEGGKWNYSFRLLHDMAGRIALAGGDDAFVDMLDRFFGFDASPVKQLGLNPDRQDVAAGYALNRFQGLNNEPDMDAPWAYHYAGRPDRTADVVHAVLMNQFGLGRGGLPGNDDSGALSSWYVWASMGLFPVAGQQIFLVNAPAFGAAEMMVGDVCAVISTEGFVEPDKDGAAQYVQRAYLNGQPLERSWITAQELHAGPKLHLELGPDRSTWGAQGRPPSIETQFHKTTPNPAGGPTQ